MKNFRRFYKGLFILCSILLLPAVLFAQADEPKSSPPPIGQQLVREGDFALKLANSLEVGSVEDEIEAETELGKVGITPRNGWIADYPMTPDVIGELHKSVRDAAASGKISLEIEEALKRLNAVGADFSVAVIPSSNNAADRAKAPKPDNFPDQTVINNYYNTEGPPVVTYYEPPHLYYNLYSWVPYPFWGFGFWYPGYFMLNDFHRVVHVRDRVVFISNHFQDVRSHRMYRIDPISRFGGRTYAGIGVTSSRRFISTGVSRGERRIFNGNRMRTAPRSMSHRPSSRGDAGFERGGAVSPGGGNQRGRR